MSYKSNPSLERTHIHDRCPRRVRGCSSYVKIIFYDHDPPDPDVEVEEVFVPEVDVPDDETVSS